VQGPTRRGVSSRGQGSKARSSWHDQRRLSSGQLQCAMWGAMSTLIRVSSFETVQLLVHCFRLAACELTAGQVVCGLHHQRAAMIAICRQGL
jgi:hypothetical protein